MSASLLLAPVRYFVLAYLELNELNQRPISLVKIILVSEIKPIKVKLNLKSMYYNHILTILVLFCKNKYSMPKINFTPNERFSTLKS